MSIINGNTNPQFKVYNKTGALVETINLPLTNKPGVQFEQYDIIQVKHQFTDYSFKQSIKGYYIHWTLHYDTWIQQTPLMDIDQLLWYCKEESSPGVKSYDVWIIPRADLPGRNFLVYCSMENFELGLIQAKTDTGHNRVVLQFSTVNLEGSLKWTPITGAGEETYGGEIELPHTGQIQT